MTVLTSANTTTTKIGPIAISDTEPEAITCPTCSQVKRYVKLRENRLSGGMLNGYQWISEKCPCDLKRTEDTKQKMQEELDYSKQQAISKAYCNLQLPKRFDKARFNSETFIVDDYNREYVEYAKPWAKSVLDQDTGLYLFGLQGRGKTYNAVATLVHAVLTGALITSVSIPITSSKSAKFVNVPDWIENCRRSYNKDSKAANEADSVFEVYLLCLDDIGIENPTEWAKERIYTLINDRYNKCLPTIITSNKKLSDLGAHLNCPPIASRIYEMCRQFEFAGSDKRLTPKKGAIYEKSNLRPTWG